MKEVLFKLNEFCGANRIEYAAKNVCINYVDEERKKASSYKRTACKSCFS